MSRKNVPDFETVPQVMAFDRHKKFRGRLQEDKPRDLKHLLELVNQSALTTTLRKVKKSDV